MTAGTGKVRREELQFALGGDRALRRRDVVCNLGGPVP